MRQTRHLAFALALSVVFAAPADAAPGTPPVVTVLGDSIAAGYGLPAAQALPAQLQDALGRLGVRAVVRGAGVSGDTTAAGLARVDFSVQPDTRLCVVELGANDYLQSVPPETMARNLTALVKRLKARHIAVLLAGGTVPASTAGGYAKAFNAVFPAIARAQGVALEPDFLGRVASDPSLRQADGLHPNARGVTIIAERLARSVSQALSRREVSPTPKPLSRHITPASYATFGVAARQERLSEGGGESEVATMPQNECPRPAAARR